MRIANILLDGVSRLGFVRDSKVYTFLPEWARLRNLPTTLEDCVTSYSEVKDNIESWLNSQTVSSEDGVTVVDMASVEYGPSIPFGKKIICVGLNYKKHVDESRMDLPKAPVLFNKFDNALAGHNETVRKPETTDQLDYEAEVGLVMGRRAYKVSSEEALDYVFGLTPTNDLSARDLQFRTSQWLLGKTCDQFCPVGPTLATLDEFANLNDLTIECRVNGEVRQRSTTSLMIFSFAELVSYISRHITLEPGDLILTGTPEGVVYGMPEAQQKWLQPGDEITVEITGLEVLRTKIG